VTTVTPCILPYIPSRLRKQIIRALRCLRLSSRLLSPQAALRAALELRHELVRAQRSAGRFRVAQPCQRGLLRLDVGERGDAAERSISDATLRSPSSRPARCARRLDQAQSCGCRASCARTGLRAHIARRQHHVLIVQANRGEASLKQMSGPARRCVDEAGGLPGKSGRSRGRGRPPSPVPGTKMR
jgi:hypothetical protein